MNFTNFGLLVLLDTIVGFKTKILRYGPKIAMRDCPKLTINVRSLDHWPYCD